MEDKAGIPNSVLFCCDHNAIRSPMAEGMMKKLYGRQAYVQSAGVHNDMEIDGFAIAVCQEIGVELSRHRTRSFDEMRAWGDDLGQFDLVVALTPASKHQALELTRHYHLEVEYWPIMDPSGLAEGREAKLGLYRQSRDQIMKHMLARFGPPIEDDAGDSIPLAQGGAA
ncbi:low molecular weight phosphatase family protein [Paracoccus chinensis]|uniref:Protein-tyrosine-phosphatase n=1 Tax=Paracoccus chinensis TaxID=525640 RepID=A0A1G9LWU7_9RHOB|nr:low molecular weight phosphatase family protein [Paracoccus chinensis]SDL66449.1 Protein-tyrosine-phosphatase [Paracoccus chinensis]